MGDRVLNPSDQVMVPNTLWEQIAPRIKAGIAAEYERISDKSPYSSGDNIDWMRAGLQYIKVIESGSKQASWLPESITGLMVVSAVMALAFGGLGAWGLSSLADSKLAGATSGFLDIAKLFAGALVGAAGATSIAKR